MEEQCVEISKKSVEKILSSLNEIKIICSDKDLEKRIKRVIDITNKEIFSKIEASLEDEIYEKMRETKKTNPDLSSKLYMLYRSYTNDKINEEDAREMYEAYIVMDNFERIVW